MKRVADTLGFARSLQRLAEPLFEQLAQEYSYLLFRPIERPSSRSSCPVNSASSSPQADLPGAQEALSFEPMKHWVECPGAQLVPMPLQFFDHAQPEDGLLARMVQNVNADQA